LNWDRIAKHLTCLRFRTTCGSGPKSKCCSHCHDKNRSESDWATFICSL